MTRWVRSGSSQKHKKMPGDATKWGEFDNQYAREIPSKKKKNVKSQTSSKQRIQSSVLKFHSSTPKSFINFSDEDKYHLTGYSNNKQENNTFDVTHFNTVSKSATNEIENSNLTIKERNIFKLKKKMKKQKNYNHSSFDEKNCEMNSDEVQHKKITLENDHSCITNEDKMSEQNDIFSDYFKNSRSAEELFSQQRIKKKKSNKAGSESLFINKKNEEISLTNDTFFNNDNVSSNIKQTVECINTLDKNSESSQIYQNNDNSFKKQKLKNQSNIINDLSQSPIENESGTNSSSKIFKNKKERYLKKLQRKREKLGLLLLPRNVECKLYKIKKRLQEKGLPPEKQKEIMRKERRKEELKYRKVHNSSKMCFGCRKPGHILADCPKKSESLKQETGICFKCGSVEHTSFKCPQKIQGFPYAKCFICKEQGHISRDCPQNKHGIYPKGGRCKLCGNVNHLKKDCPTLKKKGTENEEEDITLQIFSGNASIDAEIVKEKEIRKEHVKKAKIVKF